MVFYKYHGSGNDFILIDNRNGTLTLTEEETAALCNRHTGIGADGLILLENDLEHDFSMRYFNADGREASLCGNGGRCVVAFARRLGIINKRSKFSAADGLHGALVVAAGNNTDIISLEMRETDHWQKVSGDYVMDTGSPHLVRFVDDPDKVDVTGEGRKIRYGEPYGKEGINVNFVAYSHGKLEIRTYERGVENETLSCGTGAVASALAAALKNNMTSPVNLSAKGGELTVEFVFDGRKFSDIRLVGPATFVFKGEINIQ